MHVETLLRGKGIIEFPVEVADSLMEDVLSSLDGGDLSYTLIYDSKDEEYELKMASQNMLNRVRVKAVEPIVEDIAEAKLILDTRYSVLVDENIAEVVGEHLWALETDYSCTYTKLNDRLVYLFELLGEYDAY